MIIVKLGGGLGNQMFQFAAAKSLSLRLQTELRIDTSWFKKNKIHNGFELSTHFKIEDKVANLRDISRVLAFRFPLYLLFNNRLFSKKIHFLSSGNLVLEPHFHYWSGINKINRDSLLAGYFQSDSYFSDHWPSIKEIFSFKNKLSGLNHTVLKEINDCNSVAIHIRRGDYVTDTGGIGVCSTTYYTKAIEKLKSLFGDLKFFIFSNDIASAKDELDAYIQNATYIDWNRGNDSYIDMQLMSQCKHQIISNSSFSWWGARLASHSSQVVIAPKPWFDAPIYDDRSIAPDNWIRISKYELNDGSTN